MSSLLLIRFKQPPKRPRKIGDKEHLEDVELEPQLDHNKGEEVEEDDEDEKDEKFQEEKEEAEEDDNYANLVRARCVCIFMRTCFSSGFLFVLFCSVLASPKVATSNYQCIITHTTYKVF